MKPTRLELRGIGPFAGEPVVVEFGALGPLFVVTGATGAGKTTLFDAIAYALYGRPLGTRDAASLRARRAAEDEPTEVVFDFEHRGVPYRVARSPHAPRRGRGGKIVVEKHAYLQRGRIGAEGEIELETIADNVVRVDEAIENEILGLTHEELSKVLVLPQGEFQRFLEMGTSDRAKLLEKLFPTTLHRELTALALERAKTVEASVRAIAAQLDALGGDLPTETRDAREAAAIAAAARALAEEDEAKRAHTAATEARVTGVALLADHVRLDEVLAAIAAHASRAVTSEHDRARLERARAAQGVVAELAARDAATRAHGADVARAREAARRLEEERAKHAALVAEAEALARTTTALEARRVEVDTLRATEARLGAASAAHGLPERAASPEAGEEDADAAALLGALEAAARDREATRTLTAKLAPLVATRDRARSLEARTLPSLRRELAAHVARVDAAREEAESLGRERLAEGAALRNEHAAALARDLVPGEPCPVCGSSEHPRPHAGITAAPEHARAFEAVEARISAHAARAAELDAARTAAERALHVAEAEARLLETQLADAGFPSPQAFDEAMSGATARSEAEAAALDRLARRIARARAALTRAVDAFSAEVDAHVAARARNDAARHTSDGALVELARVLDELLATERASHEALGHAARRADDARIRAGFVDDASVRAVALDDAEQARIARALAEREAEAAALSTSEADLRARIAERPRPSREALEHAERDAAARVTHASIGVRETEAALAELRRRDAMRRALAEERAALEREGAIVRDIARDLSGDNALKLDFATYALTLWLDDVLDRASQRFARLTDGRFAFVRSELPGRGQRRAGLDIDVHDAQSGTARSVRTLSGGEKFLAALALSLGLADTVRARAGGVELDVLLIDEGFGHLDQDALGRVLGVLEDVGEGRQVGLISHVEALAQEIPSQVRVIPGPLGSRVEVIPG